MTPLTRAQEIVAAESLAIIHERIRCVNIMALAPEAERLGVTFNVRAAIMKEISFDEVRVKILDAAFESVPVPANPAWARPTEIPIAIKKADPVDDQHGSSPPDGTPMPFGADQ